MFSNLSLLLVHFAGAALACAQLAYWSVRLTTAPATPAPAAARAALVRDPDPVLAARAFGAVEQVAAVASNIQLAGVFAAGKDSAAVVSVDDRPARAVLLGDEVAPGAKLVAVDPQGITVESGGMRRQLKVPAAPAADLSSAPARLPNAGQRVGNVLTAPSVASAPDARAAARGAAGRPAYGPAPAPMPPPGLPPRPPTGGSPTAQ